TRKLRKRPNSFCATHWPMARVQPLKSTKPATDTASALRPLSGPERNCTSRRSEWVPAARGCSDCLSRPTTRPMMPKMKNLALFPLEKNPKETADFDGDSSKGAKLFESGPLGRNGHDDDTANRLFDESVDDQNDYYAAGY